MLSTKKKRNTCKVLEIRRLTEETARPYHDAIVRGQWVSLLPRNASSGAPEDSLNFEAANRELDQAQEGLEPCQRPAKHGRMTQFHHQ